VSTHLSESTEASKAYHSENMGRTHNHIRYGADTFEEWPFLNSRLNLMPGLQAPGT
ncbi:hypothetical protein AVEN_186487-1, partial [Araneus ventricosus]